MLESVWVAVTTGTPAHSQSVALVWPFTKGVSRNRSTADARSKYAPLRAVLLNTTRPVSTPAAPGARDAAPCTPAHGGESP